MSSFGRIFRVTTFGESHGGGVGCIVEGVPSNIPLDVCHIQPQLDRRRPGQSSLTTTRQEDDAVTLLSGTERGLTLGTPIAAVVKNKDMKPKDYAAMNEEATATSGYIPRPSHADYTYHAKYGIHASSGGGRSSARETVARVIAGAIADRVLSILSPNTHIVAYVEQVGTLRIPQDVQVQVDDRITRDAVDSSGPVRCPDPDMTKAMIELIENTRMEGDSIGGIVKCIIRNPPIGLGEPCFDKAEALLAHAMMSIPATKGFEIGSGMSCATRKGSDHNDPFAPSGCEGDGGRLITTKNDSGGVQGGITNGMDITMRIAFKPPATISKAQYTCDSLGNDRVLEVHGRHDPCVVPRAIPIVEAMASIVMLDLLLLQKKV